MVRKCTKTIHKNPDFIKENLRTFCWFVAFVFSVTPFFCQSNNKLDQKANELREVLKPFFVSVEKNEKFIKSNKEKIDLGRHLFFDERLSSNGKISCNSCHDLSRYGTNGVFYLNQKELGNTFRDVPSLYNIATLSMFNADGGIGTLNEKIHDAFSSKFEMQVNDESLIIEQLKEVKGYVDMFEKSFPDDFDSISFKNITQAIVVFLKGLTTPASIDRFINGDNDALSQKQIEGGHIFNDKSCYSCHTGSNFGGQMIQKLGIEVEWPNQEDMGYYESKRLSAYKMFFRVAPLRNVEKTGSYFHDSSSNELWHAVKLMGKHERGLNITSSDALKISEFLKSLTGEIPLEYINKPKKLVN